MPENAPNAPETPRKSRRSPPEPLYEDEEEAIPLGRPNTRPIPVQRPFDVPIPAAGQTWELHPEGDERPDNPGGETPRGVRYRVLSIGADNTVLIARSSSYRRVKIAAFDGKLLRYVGG